MYTHILKKSNNKNVTPDILATNKTWFNKHSLSNELVDNQTED